MGKYDIAYFQCSETGFVQTERPYWLEEAYNSPMNLTDTGVLYRNHHWLPVVGSLFYCFFPQDARFLDYAGGYGIFTRMMRDAGFDYYWDDRYTKNLVARGFEFEPRAGSIDAITAFEVFEHLPEPSREIPDVLRISSNVLFSTVLLPEPPPAVDAWWYYGLEHGQHVSFYTLRSLQHIASRHGLQFVSDGAELHFFLDPALLPQRIAASWLNTWISAQPTDVRRLATSAFTFEPWQVASNNLKSRLKNFYRQRRFPGIYRLKSDLSPEIRSALVAAKLNTSYAEHLLRHGAGYWSYFAPTFHCRVVDDMNFLKSRGPAVAGQTGR